MRWKGTPQERLIALQHDAQRAKERHEAARDRLRTLERDGRDRSAIDAAWRAWSTAYRAWRRAEGDLMIANGERLPLGMALRARASAHKPGGEAYDGLWDEHDERRAG